MNDIKRLDKAVSQKVEVLDSLRAFAALSVCVFHFICITGYFRSQWIINVFTNGQFGVQLFFVISGFVIPWSMYHANYKWNDFFRFALKRLLRLEPPYLVSLVLAIVILWGRDFFLNSNNFSSVVTVKRVLLHFGYMIPFFDGYKWLNDVYWTLATEFQYYFVIAFLFIPLVKSNLLVRILIGIIMVFLSFFGGVREFLPYWLPVFYIGIVICMYKIKMIFEKELYITLVVLFSFSLYQYHFWSVVYMAVAAIAILYFSDRRIPVLNYLGKMSYSIYLVHLPVGLTLMNILSHSLFGTNLGKISVILIGLVATLVSSYLMYILVEKPSKKLSGKIKYR